MHRVLLIGILVAACSLVAHAQSPLTAEDVAFGPDEFLSSDQLMPMDRAMMVNKKGGGVTEEEVGDVESFGRDKTYLGLAQTRQVRLRADCSTSPPEAGPCIEVIPEPAVTYVEETDLATIVLPGNSTNSLLCFTFTPFATWEWYNGGTTPELARMGLRPSVRVESDVLNDPSIVDPDTGDPYNGLLLDSTISTFFQYRTLQPGEYDYQYNATTRSCTAGIVSERMLRNSFGFSDAVIRDFFRNPITLTFGVRGEAAMVQFASYSVGIRLYGD